MIQDTAEFLWPGVPSGKVEAQIAGLSNPGKVRPNNEDYFITARYGRLLETMETNLPPHIAPQHIELGYFMLVADGMGGAAAGEVASRSAIEVLLALMLSTPDWILERNQELAAEIMRRMSERWREVNAHLREQARADPRLLGMGTTMTVAGSQGLDLILCHVGDSRAYLLRGGQLRQLTRDMTVAQDLLDAGMIKPADLPKHPMRHVLTECLGRAEELNAEMHHLSLEDGDRVLLCSDGLTEMVSDHLIAQTLHTVEEPRDACQALVDLALERGGRDNVTVVVAHYSVRRE